MLSLISLPFQILALPVTLALAPITVPLAVVGFPFRHPFMTALAAGGAAGAVYWARRR